MKITFDVVSNLLEERQSEAEESQESQAGQENSEECNEEDRYNNAAATKANSAAQAEETYQKEVEILQKLFPLKDKVREVNDIFVFFGTILAFYLSIVI